MGLHPLEQQIISGAIAKGNPALVKIYCNPHRFFMEHLYY
jgi:hypothetical protein